MSIQRIDGNQRMSKVVVHGDTVYLAGLIAAEVGFDGDIVWDTTKPNGQPRRCLDVERATRLFGFRAAHSLRDGLARTVAWYLARRSRAEAV